MRKKQNSVKATELGKSTLIFGEDLITHLNRVKDMAPALQAGEQLALEVEFECVVGQAERVAIKIVRQIRKGLVRIAFFKRCGDGYAFLSCRKIWISHCDASSVARLRPKAGC